jgi:hypothetical protein
MKVIKYNLCSVVTKVIEVVDEQQEVIDGLEPQTTTVIVTEEVLTPIILGWSEVNEEIAKKEAHNGEYTIEDDGVEKPVAEQIAELKNQLSATDYKVIKCSECQLLGEEMPYDIEALHAERQAIRDEINRLESVGITTEE